MFNSGGFSAIQSLDPLNTSIMALGSTVSALGSTVSAVGSTLTAVGSSFSASSPLIKTTFSGVTGNTTFSVTAGYLIDSVVIENTNANVITGGIKIGTTDGGVDVLAALAVGASALYAIPDAALLKRVFSTASNTTLFLQTVTLWNAANLNVYVATRKIT